MTFKVVFEEVRLVRSHCTVIAGVAVVTETKNATHTSSVATAVRFALHANVHVVNCP